ncbi:MAG: hypothetical protein RJA10_19, partial [Pseudomonadota bacterium]
RPDLIADLSKGTSLPKVSVSSSSTRAVDRIPYAGTDLVASSEVVTEGRTSGFLNQTDTLASETWVLKDGSRVLAYSVSDGAWDHEVSFLGPTTFGTGVSSLILGRDDNGAFANKYLTGDDRIIGNAGPNILYGGNGNDRIEPGAGADTINGGAGTDTTVYRDLPRSDYHVTRLSNNTVLVATKDGTFDRNTGVENLEFVDGTVAVSAVVYLPGFTSVPGRAVDPVFRFYNARDKAFFYTTSVAERDMIIRQSTDATYTPTEAPWPYFYQGTTFEQAHSSSGSVPVFRFYNTKTGHHFFTTSVAERDVVQKESTDPNYGQPGLWPFKYEGEAFRAFSDSRHTDATPVYRFYSPSLDRHFFTGNADEAAQIRLTGQWNDEGVGYWGEVAG